VVPTGQDVSVVEEIDQGTTDTYAKAREVADTQIAKEQAVHDANDAIESDVLGLWDGFIEIPYGNLTLRIRADIPTQQHDTLMRFVSGFGESSVEDTVKVFTMLTLGLYSNDEKIHETDAKFWSNTSNWSQLKAQQIVSAYMKNYKKEVDATTSFLED
jgi:hypothetical protein